MNDLLIYMTRQDFRNEIRSVLLEVLSEQENAEKEDDKKLLTRKEVAEKLHVSLPTLHEMTKAGLLKAYKIGSRVLYYANEVDQAVRDNLKLAHRRRY